MYSSLIKTIYINVEALSSSLFECTKRTEKVFGRTVTHVSDESRGLTKNNLKKKGTKQMKVKKLAGILAIVMLMTSMLSISISANEAQPAASYAEITEEYTGYLPLTNSSGNGGQLYVKYTTAKQKSFLGIKWWSGNASASNEYQNINGGTPNDVYIRQALYNDNDGYGDTETAYSDDGNSLGWVSISFGINSHYATYVALTGYGWGTSNGYIRGSR